MGDVPGRENRFDGDRRGPAALQERERPREEELELLGERESRGRTPDSAFVQAKPSLLEAHQTVSGGRGARIEAQDPHVREAEGGRRKAKIVVRACVIVFVRLLESGPAEADDDGGGGGGGLKPRIDSPRPVPSGTPPWLAALNAGRR